MLPPLLLVPSLSYRYLTFQTTQLTTLVSVPSFASAGLGEDLKEESEMVIFSVSAALGILKRLIVKLHF